MIFAALFSIIMGIAGTTPQDNPTWPQQHIDKNSGLSNSAITSIYMDSHSYVWFGTWDGLNRYDGSEIKVYKPDSFKKGTISNNIIRHFLEDKDGNLWVVTHKGINRYDRDADQFTPYLTGWEDMAFLEYNLRATLGPDSAVWTSFIGLGIHRFDTGRNDFVPVTFEGIDAAWLKQVNGISSSSGLVYLLGQDGELVCALNNKAIFRKPLIEGSKVKLHHFFQLDGHNYLALSTGDGTLQLYDLRDIEHQPQIVPIKGFPVSSLSENGNHTALWIGTEQGEIFKLTKSNEHFTVQDMVAYFPQIARAQRKIFTIAETQQDMLWVGTDGDGVFKFLTRPKPFYAIQAGPKEKGEISNSIVRSVYEDPNGTLYVGTRGGGLNIIPPAREQTRVLNTSKGLSNNTVFALNKDKQGNIWIGIDGEGIDMLEPKTGKVYHFPRDFRNKTPLDFNYVYSICVDVYGTLWLGTSGNGVIKLRVSRKNGGYYLDEYKQITHSAPNDSLPTIKSNIVYAIVEETPNVLWFGTRGAGVYRYNSLSDKIEEHFYTGSDNKTQLSNDDVLNLYVSTKSEALWIGTSGGLNRMTLQGRPYRNKHYAKNEGLPNNTIHGILEDSKGLMWLSSNSGLVLFDAQKETFKSFDTNDGLQNYEYTDGAFFPSAISDRLYFGGIDGLDIIYPAKLDLQTYFPRLTVSEFQIHNVTVMPSDSNRVYQKHIDLVDKLDLAYDQNFISFHFTTLDYWNKQRTEYAYFLEGFDKDWNYIGHQSVVNLTNIPPGEYQLHINYTDENGVWNPTAKAITIVVNPPWWKTRWAYAGYALLLTAFQVAVIMYIRQRAKARREAAIDKFKISQMEELNEYKLQFFTNIAHEFRTPLTLILGPVTSLLKKATEPRDRAQLNVIYSSSLRLQKLIEELIQFRKIEIGKEKPEVAQVELVAFTQGLIESFQQYANELDVNLEFAPEPEVLKGWVDARIVEKILINLISNAIKYNIRGGQVTIRLQEQRGEAHFTIQDTGVGIAEDAKEHVFEIFFANPLRHQHEHGVPKSSGIGLSLTKRLVDLHKGTIHLTSDAGKGSIFTVTLPLEREAYEVDDDAKTFILPVTDLAEKVSQEFGYLNPVSQTTTPAPAAAEDLYTVLIVDDHEQILLLLQSILSDKYKIHSAANGQEALKILEEEKIDLVISDVLMPGMDGLTLCRHIKDNIQTSHIPVILLTAKSDIEDRIEGLQVGADSYIPKPFHPEHLFVRIEKLIKGREQTRKRFENFADAELDHIFTGMGEKDDAFFVKIVQCIQDHLSEPQFTADTIAEEVGMSKASLYKKVKAITGITPHGLIKQYRLRKAADLLKHSTMSVSEVIYETGFNSRSYFYKSFNEMYHCHPKDFGGAKTG